MNLSAIAAYAASNLLPLPSSRSIIDEARVLAVERGRSHIGARDVKQALASRQRSDLAIRAAFGSRPKSQRRQSLYRQVGVADPQNEEPAAETEQMSTFSRSGDGEQPPIRMRAARVTLTVP